MNEPNRESDINLSTLVNENDVLYCESKYYSQLKDNSPIC